MSYNKIKNPITNRYVNINTKLGKFIINNYLNQIGGGLVYDPEKDGFIIKKVGSDFMKVRSTLGNNLGIINLLLKFSGPYKVIVSNQPVFFASSYILFFAFK